MDNGICQQMLAALERQRMEIAERDAAWAKEKAECDTARASEMAEPRDDIIKATRALRKDAERYRERITEIGGGLCKTMMYMGVGIAAWVIAVVGVAVVILVNSGFRTGIHTSSVSAPPAQSYQLSVSSQTGSDAAERENAQPPHSPWSIIRSKWLDPLLARYGESPHVCSLILHFWDPADSLWSDSALATGGNVK